MHWACYILGALSGSGVGAPRAPGLSAEVKMDEMATVMNARSDRWMNGKHGGLTTEIPPPGLEM